MNNYLMDNQSSRDQISNLILKSPEGEDLHVVSELISTKTYMVFDVANSDNSERYRVSVEIEEI